MKFSEQLKTLRQQHHLTQQALADDLHVSRQAISNWENDKNMPDIEVLIDLAQLFDISLDELILGEKDLTKKLIHDGSVTRQAHLAMVSNVAGALVILMGLLCFMIKSQSIEYVDAQGVLHENFFLIPVGYGLIFIGILIILSQFLFIRKNKHTFPGK